MCTKSVYHFVPMRHPLQALCQCERVGVFLSGSVDLAMQNTVCRAAVSCHI